ncbi:hypothetical protein niasHS_010199 [Heterodera schachtii]|uniref:ShKT domain-containing protein n=1 Tax=Heterodera schachtii TaxID=97005 RepID=A0ABD2J437_HETSC
MPPLCSTRVVLLLVLLLLRLVPRPFRCGTLPSAVRNDCSASEAFFGPCLPGTPRTCPGTCPPGCRCTVDSCCYPSSNPGPNPSPPVPQPQTNVGNGGFNMVNLALLMLLFRQRSLSIPSGGYGTSAAFSCQDTAWNCFQFAPMCAYSLRMVYLCPRTCGLCPSLGFGTAMFGNGMQTQIALANELGSSAIGKK